MATEKALAEILNRLQAIDDHIEALADQIEQLRESADLRFYALRRMVGNHRPMDDKYALAEAAVVEAGKASTSYLQHKLGVGYSRACALMDQLERLGVIAPADGAKPRKVLVASMEVLAELRKKRPIESDPFEQTEQEYSTGFLSVFDSMADGEIDEHLYERARAAVIAVRKASTSHLQRKLGIGYSRAAKLIDMLEDNGVIGPADGAKPRQVLLRA